MLTYLPRPSPQPTWLGELNVTSAYSPLFGGAAVGGAGQLSAGTTLCRHPNPATWQYDFDNDSWLNHGTLAALQSNAIWLDSDDVVKPLSFITLAELNKQREAVGERLEQLESAVVYDCTVDAKLFESIPDCEWTYHLENTISTIFPQAASGSFVPFVSIYQSGALIYQTFIDCVSWLAAPPTPTHYG